MSALRGFCLFVYFNRFERFSDTTVFIWISFVLYLYYYYPSNSFFYSALVSISVFMALSTVFLPSINSPDNLPLSYSVLPILILPYWSIQLYISLAKSPSALI